MSKRNMYSLLFLLIVFTIIIGIAYLFSYGRKKDNYSKLSIVKDYNIYFSVVENVNYFLNTLDENNDSKLYSLLDSNYIKIKRIKKSNVLNKVKSERKNVIFSGDKIYYLVNDNKYLFLATGYLNSDEEESEEFYKEDYKIALIINYDSLLVSFYPLDKVEDINKIVDFEINVSSFNVLKSSNPLSNNNMCKLYYSQFVDYVNNDINELYNIMVDDIKVKYSINDFSSIVKKKYNNYNSNFNICSVDYNKEKGTRVFKLEDNKKNIINFYEDGVMNFKVKINLD